MRVAVDAMGGDHGPSVVVPGAVAGARAVGADLLLVGRTAEIAPALAAVDTAGVSVDVLDAPDVVGMDEHPAQAVRRKPDSSIVRAMRAVKEGQAGAMASAGNSGAVMAAALLILGRVPGIERPAIASYLPALTGRTLVLDLGAVADPRPAHLAQFARMGNAYAQRVGGIPQPRVGLLSNGEEPTKGNQLVQDAFVLLAATPGLDFRGNVEGRDITAGTVDVVVTDGFTGNVALKVAEGVGTLIAETLRAQVTATLPRKLAALALRSAFRAVGARLDYRETGGAALLGVDGVVVIAHGRSDAIAIANAVRVAHQAGQADLTGQLRAAFATVATGPAAGDAPESAPAS